MIPRFWFPSTPEGEDFNLLQRPDPEAFSLKRAAHLSAISKNVNTL
jgi:hypothetical protein